MLFEGRLTVKATRMLSIIKVLTAICLHSRLKHRGLVLMAVTRFILQAPGTGIVSSIGILPRVAESVDGTIFDGCRCGRSLNCKVGGRFENFLSASGRDLDSVTGFSPWVALSEGREWLERSPP